MLLFILDAPVGATVPTLPLLDIRDAPLLRPAAGERWPNNEKPCCAACCSSCRLREAQPRARSQDEISSFIDGVARRRTSAVSTNTRALSLDTLFDLMLDLSVKALCYLGTVCHDPLGFLQIRRDHQARAELARRTSGRESPRRNASSAAG